MTSALALAARTRVGSPRARHADSERHRQRDRVNDCMSTVLRTHRRTKPRAAATAPAGSATRVHHFASARRRDLGAAPVGKARLEDPDASPPRSPSSRPRGLRSPTCSSLDRSTPCRATTSRPLPTRHKTPLSASSLLPFQPALTSTSSIETEPQREQLTRLCEPLYRRPGSGCLDIVAGARAFSCDRCFRSIRAGGGWPDSDRCTPMRTSIGCRIASAALALVVVSCQPESVSAPTTTNEGAAHEGAAGDSAVGVAKAGLILGSYTYTPSADTVLRSAIPYGNDGPARLGLIATAADVERRSCASTKPISDRVPLERLQASASNLRNGLGRCSECGRPPRMTAMDRGHGPRSNGPVVAPTTQHDVVRPLTNNRSLEQLEHDHAGGYRAFQFDRDRRVPCYRRLTLNVRRDPDVRAVRAALRTTVGCWRRANLAGGEGSLSSPKRPRP